MSSDEYFDDELDSAFLNEVDLIEATRSSAPTAASCPAVANPPPIKPAAVYSRSPSRVHKRVVLKDTPDPIVTHDPSSEYGFDDFPMDDADFARIDQDCQRQYAEIQRKKSQHPGLNVAGSSSGLVRRPSKGAQLTLFGEVAQETDPSRTGESSKRTFQRTRSTLRQMPLPGQAKRTKQWDRTAYAKTGWRKPKANPDKGKGRASDDEGDEPLEFEQFPAPENRVGPIPLMKLSADRLAAKTWIYPLNKPKRDYQYNIVKKCLLENTLVALPTGLGKTFIAGVVMLNYYNWFPQGKVVFVAPTKPLVAQQIDACHKTCGIPGSAAAELTGNVSKEKRMNAWSTKRVFYATPQTLLNALINGHVDALDIVLLVIDEAHRGTGDYAYAQVVRYMMQHNPHFRILALTATPGGKPEAVQEIVDALHISHIEIRSESDPDLKKYLHTKHEQEHLVPMTDDIAVLRDALAAVITPILKKVQNAGFLKNGNVSPTMLHPFRCQSTVGEMSKARAPNYAISAAAQLGPLARAMGYLMENSIAMCYGYLKDVAEGDGSGAKKALRKAEGFESLMKKLEEQARRGFSMHPKMDVLRTLLIDNFAKQLPDDVDENNGQAKGSRAMVFVSFRECVEEIVELLNKESPIIRAKAFIGQGTDKQGKKGYAQKEQLEVIKQFKEGTFNVLVSTSIGEEGLDIGEVDVIVCYDAQKTPIRMLQRIGRTGRKASGTVHILLAKGREEHNWQKAQSNYAEVQHFIVRASDLEVYGDVERLIPDDIEPACVEMEMDIEEYVREERSSRKGSMATGDSPKGRKRKRDNDPMRNVPASAAKGFVSVSQLLIKNGAKRTKNLPKVDLEHGDEDDSDDEEIEAGIFGPRRTKSASAAQPGKGSKKALARSTTVATSSSKKTSAGRKRKGKQAVLTGEDLGPVEDTDDEEIEEGPLAAGRPTKGRNDVQTQSRALSGFRSARDMVRRSSRSSSPDIPLNESVIDITSSSSPPPQPSARAMFDSSPEKPLKSRRSKRATILDSPSSSEPEEPLKATTRRGTSIGSRSNKPSQSGESSKQPDRSKSPSSRSPTPENPAAGDDSFAWLVADDEDPHIPDLPASPILSGTKARGRSVAQPDEPLFLPSSSQHSPILLSEDERNSPDILLLSDDEPLFMDEPPIPSRQLNNDVLTSPQVPESAPSKEVMGPPALPARLTNASPSRSDDWPPEPTFAVRAPGRHVRKRVLAEVLDLESSPLSPAVPAQRRLQHDRPREPSSPMAAHPPPPKKKKRRFEDTADARRHNPWIDVEATHSGDELSVGSSEPDTLPDSDDRMFVDEPNETQVSPSYDQSAVYRQSLMTQVPGGGGPAFANRPVRRGQARFGPVRAGAGPSRYGHGRAASSSPTNAEDDEPDEYVFGSFVVDDDAEISYTGGGPSSDF